MAKKRAGGEKDYLMENMTVADMRAALKKTDTVILPVGGVEQHGYHLPLTTDAIIAYSVAKEAGLRARVLVAPCLNYSYSVGRLPGTTNIQPETLTAVIIDIGRSLFRQGVRNFVIFSGHCGGVHLKALNKACHQLLNENPKVEVALIPSIETSAKGRELRAAKRALHAGLVETSLMLYLRPELVKEDWRVEDRSKFPQPLSLPESFILRKAEAWRERRTSMIKIGVWADPKGANKELGREIFEEMVEDVVAVTKLMKRKKKPR